jgi:diaminopimelate epimerase
LIPFTKAHACGNDFLIVAEEAAGEVDRAELTRRLCARNTGVGADGVEFFAWTGPRSGRICLHNADGTIAEISGNGTRCVAAWMAEERGARSGEVLEIETDAGLRKCRVNAVHIADGFSVDVTATMGVPAFTPQTVAISGGVRVEGVAVSTGNPHFVIAVTNEDFAVDRQRWQSVGQQICGHPDFPHQTNVEFVRILKADKLEIRIYERGVGPTNSSGTGTSAAAVAAIALHGCSSPLLVNAPGGAQVVEWNGPGTELELTGPAALIARGEAW